MQRITGLLLSLTIAAIAGSARAQVDCNVPGACTTTQYGLGTQPDYRKDEVPPNPLRYDDSFFGPDIGGVSFFATHNDFFGTIGTCGPRSGHSPLPGQLLLREQTDCVPTSQGPSCSAGNVGRDCHLPTLNEACTAAGVPLTCCLGAGSGTCIGFRSSAPNTLECGAGGVCSLGAGVGCRVEIPISDGGVTPVADTSEVMIFTLVHNFPSGTGDTVNLSAQSGNTFGGSSDDANPICLDESVRRRPTTGTRYLLPASRGGDGTKTYVRWDSAKGIPPASRPDFATSFRTHIDDTAVCCAAGNPQLGTCGIVFPPTGVNYPLLTRIDCSIPRRFTNEDNVGPDLIFTGGRGTVFYTDPDFVLPGQIPGICKVNRGVACYKAGANAACAGLRNPYSCCTGLGTGTCTQDCTGLDADPVTSGVQPDTCDFRTPGYRVQNRCDRNADNDSRTDCCGTAFYVLRGRPDEGCSVIPRFAYDGDPGPDCGVGNYGIDHRDDMNCNGIDDQVDAGSSDLCVFYSEWDQDLDRDPDCDGGPGGKCRGDECECGDQSGDGTTNVVDIVAINSAIFGATVQKRLCDANADTECDVSDIVSANVEAFTPDSSVCRHITPRQCRTGVPAPCCGNGLLEVGEICDDGDFDSADGCNLACRVEFGFTCSGEPSVCS